MTQPNKSNEHLSPAESVLPTKNLSKAPKIYRAVDLDDPALFHNRELSHVEFNRRVLSQATNNQYPILERLNFLTIFSSNLDEFYEIRVAGLKKQTGFGRQRPGPDGTHPEQVLEEIHKEVRSGLDQQYQILNEELLGTAR